MSNLYSNIPYAKVSSNESTLQAFDIYFSAPLELNAGTFDAISGFFNSRGFDIIASQSIASIIMKQAKIENYNPMKILDTLKGLDSVEISRVVSEILNYNRFKTSILGYAAAFNTNYEISRNILP